VDPQFKFFTRTHRASHPFPHHLLNRQTRPEEIQKKLLKGKETSGMKDFLLESKAVNYIFFFQFI